MARQRGSSGLAAPRLIALVLLGLLVAIQYPLWLGKGSQRTLLELKTQLAEQREDNQNLRDELDRLQAQIESLREGKEAVESRARERLNMIKEDEILFRLSQEPPASQNPSNPQ